MPADSLSDNGGQQGGPVASPPVEEDPAKPMLSIDKTGYLSLSIPLYKTPEVFARGMVDVCRTEVLKWYQAQAQKRRETEILAAKTGFQRFRDRLKL